MKDRVVIVTGGLGALGRVVANSAVARGAKVGVLDVAPTPPPDLVEALGARALFVTGADLSAPEGAERAIAAVAAKFDGVDALINIAGGFAWEKVEGGAAATWRRLFDLNLGATLNASRAALPYLLKSSSGRIVNVGANAALKAGEGMGAYAASKSAVHRLTEAMAEETKGRGVTVNAVLPSTIDTPANRRDMPSADFSKWVKPEELAAVILFLASQAASGVTGALIPVTGRV